MKSSEEERAEVYGSLARIEDKRPGEVYTFEGGFMICLDITCSLSIMYCPTDLEPFWISSCMCGRPAGVRK